MIRLGNNEVLKTLTKTLTFVDANANFNADAGGSTIPVSILRKSISGRHRPNVDLRRMLAGIALPERFSGELIMRS